jgi:AraC-like DNA-binding protein
MEGGISIDRTFYRAQKNCFSLAKPGQTEQMVHPNRCYHFSLVTDDQMLKHSLDSLPTFGYHPEMEKIFSIIQRIIDVPEKTHMYSRMEVMSGICTILSMLLQQTYTIPDRSDFHINRHQKALMNADKYLREHLNESIDLAFLAKDSGLHPTYFHKLFTAAFGSPPMQKLNSYRIANAVGYLISTTRSIEEISSICGFSSQNYFTVKFKEAIGMTPTQFRKERRQVKTAVEE